MKKAFLLVMIGVMLISTFAGCASSPNEPISSSTPASSSTASSASSADDSQSTAVPEEKAMYPMEGNITIDYWMPINQNATKFITSYAENESYIEAQARTGINVKFIHPVVGKEKEQFNLLMASGDLPDLMQSAGGYYEGGEFKGHADGAFLDLTPYLEEYAPDYLARINMDAEIRREVYTDEDQVLAFYKIQPDGVPPFTRPMVRQDWLEEFNMDAPMTFDEFEAYFKAIKENKPGVVPFMLARSGDVADEVFYGAFNLLPEWFVVDGQVRHGKASDELKDYLTLLNDWYKKGYISKDFPSIDSKQVNAEFDSGKIGMVVDSVESVRNRTLPINLPVISTPYPRPAADSKLHCLNATWPRAAGEITCVASTSQKVEAAMKFINYAYTDEGQMLYNYGVEGKTYTMVDGKPKYTDYVLNNPKFGAEVTNYILRIHFAPKYLPGSPLEFNPSIAKDPGAVENRMRYSDDPNCDNAYRIPPISLSPEESSRRGEIMTNVKTYANEMILKFIIGSEPIENFDKYLEQLKKYGIEEAIEITQTAYDRYMSK